MINVFYEMLQHTEQETEADEQNHTARYRVAAALRTTNEGRKLKKYFAREVGLFFSDGHKLTEKRLTFSLTNF